MKSVWIIWNDADYYGPDLAAIYETKELADKALADLKKEPYGYDYYVKEYKLNTLE